MAVALLKEPPISPDSDLGPYRRGDYEALPDEWKQRITGMQTACSLLSPARFKIANPDIVRDQQQWVLDAINVAGAWPVSQGAGVTVAVIDSGVDGDVPDLAGLTRIVRDVIEQANALPQKFGLPTLVDGTSGRGR